MRTILVVSALVAASALVPSASAALTWCVFVGPESHRCETQYACLGWRRDETGERCEFAVPDQDWCRYLCWSGPPLA